MSSVREQADELIAAVETAFDEAEGEWTGMGVSLGSLFGVGSQDQVLGAIRGMRSGPFEAWRNRINSIAATNQAALTRWVQDGNDMLKNLADTAQDANTNSLPAIVAETATATAVDAAEGAADAGKALWNQRYFIVGAVVLVLGVAGFVFMKVRP